MEPGHAPHDILPLVFAAPEDLRAFQPLTRWVYLLLERHGPQSAGALADATGASCAQCERALRDLESLGQTRRGGRRRTHEGVNASRDLSTIRSRLHHRRAALGTEQQIYSGPGDVYTAAGSAEEARVLLGASPRTPVVVLQALPRPLGRVIRAAARAVAVREARESGQGIALCMDSQAQFVLRPLGAPVPFTEVVVSEVQPGERAVNRLSTPQALAALKGAG